MAFDVIFQIDNPALHQAVHTLLKAWFYTWQEVSSPFL